MGKILWFDTETTGLTENSAIVSFAAIIEINGEVKEEMQIFMAPHMGADISEKALEVNGLSMDQILSYQQYKSGYLQIANMMAEYIDRYDKMDKFIPAGKNISFDINKLYELYNRIGDKYLGSYLWGVKIDLEHVVAELIYSGKLSLPNHKLTTLADFYGISIDAHNAMSDIRATRELYYLLREMNYHT